jgi:hypothetical protein
MRGKLRNEPNKSLVFSLQVHRGFGEGSKVWPKLTNYLS